MNDAKSEAPLQLMASYIFNFIFDFDDVSDGAGREPTGLQTYIGHSLIQRADSSANIQLSNVLPKLALRHDKHWYL